MRVPSNGFFWWKFSTEKFENGELICVTLALTLTLSPEAREQPAHILVLRLTVRQIQPCEFSKRRRTILLLLGEKAGMREDVKSNHYAMDEWSKSKRAAANSRGQFTGKEK
jgi:hypothetical protein